MRKSNVFCRELANTRPTKELKAFFALAESLPTSTTLLVTKTQNNFPKIQTKSLSQKILWTMHSKSKTKDFSFSQKILIFMCIVDSAPVQVTDGLWPAETLHPICGFLLCLCTMYLNFGFVMYFDFGFLHTSDDPYDRNPLSKVWFFWCLQLLFLIFVYL